MTYEPRGGAAMMIQCREEGVLFDGPVNTGKTMAVLYKGVYCANKYPKARILLARRTRKSLTESVLVTLEEKIFVPGVAVKMNGGSREHRSSYEFPNGSVMVCGGMDPGAGVNNRASIMSTEWDMALLFESTEFTEDEIEKVQTRLRNGAMPYQQLVMDCNPGPPSHFLIRGAGEKWDRIPSRHKDNPRLWDENLNAWTAEGIRYMALLDKLTGHRRARLRDGLWAASEGSVYPEWDAAVHLIDPFEIPKDWRRFRVIDFGYTNPFVCQWWAVDGDGRMYLYREVYHSKRIVADHAQDIKALSAGETYETTIADHDAEDRATLARGGIDTAPAIKDVSPGLQAVADRLRPAGDGKPRLFIFRDVLHRRDPVLTDAKKPCCTAEEFDGYMWAKAPDGKPIKEEPVKVDDHGMDAMRYMVMHLDAGSVYSAGLVGKLKPELRIPGTGVATIRKCVCCGRDFETDGDDRYCSVKCELDEKRKDPEWGF